MFGTRRNRQGAHHINLDAMLIASAGSKEKLRPMSNQLAAGPTNDICRVTPCRASRPAAVTLPDRLRDPAPAAGRVLPILLGNKPSCRPDARCNSLFLADTGRRPQAASGSQRQPPGTSPRNPPIHPRATAPISNPSPSRTQSVSRPRNYVASVRYRIPVTLEQRRSMITPPTSRLPTLFLPRPRHPRRWPW